MSEQTDSLDRLRSALSDRYAIEHELGAGGMATVYLAEDTTTSILLIGYWILDIEYSIFN